MQANRRLVVLIVFLSVFLINAGVASATDEERPVPVLTDVTPEWLNQYPAVTVCNENYLYICDSYPILHIYDISDPANPRFAGNVETLPGVKHMAIDGNRAFLVGTSGTMQILDILHPESAYEAGRIEIDNDVNGIVASGDYVYLCFETSWPLTIVDISSPSDAHIVSSVQAAWPMSIIGYSNGYIFAKHNDHGDYYLDVIDVHPADNPQIVQSISIEANSYFTCICGDFIYSSNGRTLKWIDIHDPTNPRMAGSVDLPYGMHKLHGDGEYLYALCHDNDLFSILHIDADGRPDIVKTLSIPPTSWYFDIRNGFAYIADGRLGILIADVDPVENTSIVGILGRVGCTREIEAEDGYLCYIEVTGGRVIDVTTPEYPVFLEFPLTMYYPCEILVSDNKLYVGSCDGSVYIYELDLPDSMRLVRSFNVMGCAVNLGVTDDALFVASPLTGLKAFDISSVESMQCVNHVAVPFDVGRMVLSDGTLCLEVNENSLCVFNVSSAGDIELADKISISGFSCDLAIDGNYLLAAKCNEGVVIYDIENPESVNAINTIQTEGSARSVAVIDGYAFIGAGPGVLQVWDIEPIETARFVTSMIVPYSNSIDDITISDGYIYLACGLAGIRIIKLDWQ